MKTRENRVTQRSIVLAGALLVVAGCAVDRSVESPQVVAGTEASSAGASGDAGGPSYFPVGTRIPQGQALTSVPEPYDPAKHGPPLANSHPEWNLGLMPENRGRYPQLHSGMMKPTKKGSYPQLSPNCDHTNRGFWLYQNSQAWYGMYALQDARTDFQVPYYSDIAYPNPQPMLISPTMEAPGGACLEISIIHSAISNNPPTTSHAVTWADWCNSINGVLYGSPTTWYDLTNPAFAQDYIRPYNGQPTVTVYIVTPNTGHTNGQCWSSGLYNYTVGGYVEFANSCGFTQSSFGTYGWTMYEDYSLFAHNDCPAVAPQRSEIIELYHPSYGYGVQFTSYPTDYSTLDLTNFLDCFYNGVYVFQSPAPNTLPNSWKVATQIP